MKRAESSSSSPVAELALSPSVALLKQALAEKGLRQQELANRTGLSKDHVSRILLGKVPFPKSRDTLLSLAKALDLDPLLFLEYRKQLAVLPESTRRLTAQLKAKGISQQAFIKRVPRYSEGHLQLILRGGTPFPRDPEVIEHFAAAAETSPYLFPEYLPLGEWRDRVRAAAALALDPADVGVFMHLWGKMERHFEQLEPSGETFEDRLLRYMVGRAVAPELTPLDPEFEEARGYLPPWEHYQREVRLVLERMVERGLTVSALASAVGGEEATLHAIANGQLKLKDGALKEKLYRLLDLTNA